MRAPIDIRPFPRPLPMPLPAPTNAADEATFNLLNGNGDTAVDAEEWKQAGWTEDRFKAFDGNGDGKVTKKEFTDAMRFEREFNEKDRNGDGKLSRLEMAGLMFHRFAKGNIGGGLKAMADSADGVKDFLLRRIPPQFPGMDRFAKFDKNGDASISKEEYLAGRRAESKPVLTPIPFPHKPLPTGPIFKTPKEMIDLQLETKAEQPE